MPDNPSPLPDETPPIIDEVYLLGKRIGRGGMSAVFMAEVDLEHFDYTSIYSYVMAQGNSHLQKRQNALKMAESLNRENIDRDTIRKILIAQNIPIPTSVVAVKVATDKGRVERFEAEWTSLLCLNHPHLIKVYGGGYFRKRNYYAMELLENIATPEQVMTNFTMQQKLDIIIQGGKGLEYLHKNGIVHRDVKLSNLITCKQNGEWITRVTDLGVAIYLEEKPIISGKNPIVGTLYYMSPEQILASNSVNPQADIYSLGATLYQFVTNQKPFHDKSTYQTFQKLAASGAKPLDPQKIVSNVPEVILKIIRCAMHNNLQLRYQNMREIVEDVTAFQQSHQAILTKTTSFAQLASDFTDTHSYNFLKYTKEANSQSNSRSGRLRAAPHSSGKTDATTNHRRKKPRQKR